VRPSLPRRRTRRPREERRSEILAIARKVFAERGYDAASVAEIARRGGVVEGTVYAYFPTKRDLLVEVLRGFYEPLIAEAEASLKQIRGAESRLRFLIARQLRAFTQDLDLCRLVIREIRPDLELYGDAVHGLNRRYTAVALETIEQGIRDGELRADLVPSVVRDLIYGGIEHAVWGFVFSGEPVDVETVTDQLARAVLSGILAREAPAERTAERLERVLTKLEERIAG
jgi:AcrR family transcriptional regulator